MAKERKELIVLDGMTILFIVMLVINGVAAALLYKWHNAQVFNEKVLNRKVYGDLLAEARSLKNSIVKDEGAESWEKSAYQKVVAFHERGKKSIRVGGIAMDYPADYVSEVSKDGNHIVLMTAKDFERIHDAASPASDGPMTITVDTYDIGAKPLLLWIKESQESNGKLMHGDFVTTPVGELTSTMYQWSGLYEGVTYAIESQKGKVVLLTVTYITRGDELLRDFDLIASTVRKD